MIRGMGPLLLVHPIPRFQSGVRSVLKLRTPDWSPELVQTPDSGLQGKTSRGGPCAGCRAPCAPPCDAVWRRAAPCGAVCAVCVRT
eukprot:gene9367-biopygen1280